MAGPKGETVRTGGVPGVGVTRLPGLRGGHAPRAGGGFPGASLTGLLGHPGEPDPASCWWGWTWLGGGGGLRLGWEELTPTLCSLRRVLLVTRGWSGPSERPGGR